MEYTALCDNRVKNIHMRTDNAGEEKIRIKGTNNYYFEGNDLDCEGPAPKNSYLLLSLHYSYYHLL